MVDIRNGSKDHRDFPTGLLSLGARQVQLLKRAAERVVGMPRKGHNTFFLDRKFVALRKFKSHKFVMLASPDWTFKLTSVRNS